MFFIYFEVVLGTFKCISKLTPVPFEKVWGGSKLKKIKGLGHLLNVGETWEISVNSCGESKICGENLSTYIGSSLSYLVKFIDTSDNLSVQVHPDNLYAKKNESATGKDECWVILEAAHGAGIYLGFRDGVSKDQLKEAVRNGDQIDKLLNFYPVKKGDFFNVPAGTVHAIGKDVLLVEVQQNSGLTYRVWDWNRPGLDGMPRELHLDKSLDVLNFEKEFNTKSFFKYKNILKYTKKELLIHDDFKVSSYNVNNNSVERISISINDKVGVICLGGRIELVKDNKKLSLSPYESAIIAGFDGDIQISNDENSLYLIITSDI